MQKLPKTLWFVWTDVTKTDGTRSVGPVFETFDENEVQDKKIDYELYYDDNPDVKDVIIAVYGLPIPEVVPLHPSRQSNLYVVTEAELLGLTKALDDYTISIRHLLLR